MPKYYLKSQVIIKLFFERGAFFFELLSYYIVIQLNRLRVKVCGYEL